MVIIELEDSLETRQRKIISDGAQNRGRRPETVEKIIINVGARCTDDYVMISSRREVINQSRHKCTETSVMIASATRANYE